MLVWLLCAPSKKTQSSKHVQRVLIGLPCFRHIPSSAPPFHMPGGPAKGVKPWGAAASRPGCRLADMFACSSGKRIFHIVARLTGEFQAMVLRTLITGICNLVCLHRLSMHWALQHQKIHNGTAHTRNTATHPSFKVYSVIP